MMQRLLPLARLAVLGLVALCAVVFVVSLPLHWRELAAACAPPLVCSPLQLRPLEVDALRGLGLSLPLYATLMVAGEALGGAALLVMGGLILWRRGRSAFGLLAAVTLASFGALLTEGNSSLVHAYPAAAPAVDVVQTLGVLGIAWLFLAFPNGRFVPRLGWVLTLLPLAAVRLWMLGQGATGGRLAADSAVWLVYGYALLAGLAYQVYRYRRVSNALERQQTKWVVLGLAGAAAALLVWVAFIEIGSLPPGRPQVLFNLLGLPFAALLITSFPVTLGFSILRYRLWDIDLFIRRAMLYGALTVCLGTGYFVSVIVFQMVLEVVAGASLSGAAIVLSTLLQAALFEPLHRRLQAMIDRRFYRSRYVMARVLAGFGQRMRGEMDIDALRAGLVTVVNDTLQPEWSAVWLAGPKVEPAAEAQPAADVVERAPVDTGLARRRGPLARRRVKPRRRARALAPSVRSS